MSENRLEVLGIKGVISIFDNASRDLMDAARKELPDIGDGIVKNIKLDMRNTPKTGRKYRGGKSSSHTASSPGNAPAIDSGNLMNKIVSIAERNRVEVGALDGAPYAVWLEEGTRNMEARPWLSPAIKEREISEKIMGRIEDKSRNL